jgi:hypothetical protein
MVCERSRVITGLADPLEPKYGANQGNHELFVVMDEQARRLSDENEGLAAELVAANADLLYKNTEVS